MSSQSSAARECWCEARRAVVVGAWAAEDHPGQLEEPRERFTLVRCEGCGVFALHPQPSHAQLKLAYSADYYGASPRKFVAPIAGLVGLFQGSRARMVARRVGRASAILDIGCGNGGFLQQMRRRGFAVEGTEWTQASAARASRQAGIEVHVGDLLELDLPSNTYDAITLWHVFEHLRKPHETLMRIRSLLKPGGVVFMSMPNAESNQARRYGLNWFHHDPPRHLFGFGPLSLSHLLDRTGFHLERLTTFSLEQNPFGEIQSRLNSASARKRCLVQPRIPGRDRLYRQLKGLVNDVPRRERVGDLLMLVALCMPALLRSTLESANGRGATMAIQACRA